MKYLFCEHVLPGIAHLEVRRSHQIHFRTFGYTESGVQERLRDIESLFPGVTMGYRAHFPEIEVKILAERDVQPDAEALANEAAAEVEERLGAVIFGGRHDSFASVVGRALRDRGLRVAIAESCTGGRVGQMLTSEPGSSQFLILDAVTYANEAKRDVLGVPEDLLVQHGAVSEPCARKMAEGVLALSSADVSVAITGIAGPDGGTKEKPVGTVWFAVTTKDGETFTHCRTLPGDRERVQTLAAYIALRSLLRAARGEPVFDA